MTVLSIYGYFDTFGANFGRICSGFCVYGYFDTSYGGFRAILLWGLLSMSMSIDLRAGRGQTYYQVFHPCLFHYIWGRGLCEEACYGASGPGLIVSFSELILRTLVMEIVRFATLSIIIYRWHSQY